MGWPFAWARLRWCTCWDAWFGAWPPIFVFQATDDEGGIDAATSSWSFVAATQPSDGDWRVWDHWEPTCCFACRSFPTSCPRWACTTWWAWTAFVLWRHTWCECWLCWTIWWCFVQPSASQLPADCLPSWACHFKGNQQVCLRIASCFWKRNVFKAAPSSQRRPAPADEPAASECRHYRVSWRGTNAHMWRKTCLDCSFAQSTEPRRVHSDITTANLADFLGGELTADEAVGSARSFRNAVKLKLSQLEPGGTINSKTLIEALALSLSLAEVCHGRQKAPSSSAARSEPHEDSTFGACKVWSCHASRHPTCAARTCCFACWCWYKNNPRYLRRCQLQQVGAWDHRWQVISWDACPEAADGWDQWAWRHPWQDFSVGERFLYHATTPSWTTSTRTGYLAFSAHEPWTYALNSQMAPWPQAVELDDSDAPLSLPLEAQRRLGLVLDLNRAMAHSEALGGDLQLVSHNVMGLCNPSDRPMDFQDEAVDDYPIGADPRPVDDHTLRADLTDVDDHTCGADPTAGKQTLGYLAYHELKVHAMPSEQGQGQCWCRGQERQACGIKRVPSIFEGVHASHMVARSSWSSLAVSIPPEIFSSLRPLVTMATHQHVQVDRHQGQGSWRPQEVDPSCQVDMRPCTSTSETRMPSFGGKVLQWSGKPQRWTSSWIMKSTMTRSLEYLLKRSMLTFALSIWRTRPLASCTRSALASWCSRDHLHEPLEGGSRCKKAQAWTEEFCTHFMISTITSRDPRFLLRLWRRTLLSMTVLRRPSSFWTPSSLLRTWPLDFCPWRISWTTGDTGHPILKLKPWKTCSFKKAELPGANFQCPHVLLWEGCTPWLGIPQCPLCSGSSKPLWRRSQGHQCPDAFLLPSMPWASDIDYNQYFPIKKYWYWFSKKYWLFQYFGYWFFGENIDFNIDFDIDFDIDFLGSVGGLFMCWKC